MVEFAENLNPETFNRVLNELLEQGVSRRVAEGRARRVAMVEYNREHGEEEAAPAAAAPSAGAARGGAARRAGAGRPSQHLPSLADPGAAVADHRHRRADRVLHVRQRPAARAGQPEPDPEPVEGAVVLPGPPGAAAVLPPDGGWGDRADAVLRPPVRAALRRPQPELEAR